MSSAVAEEDRSGPRRKILKLGSLSASAMHERRAPGKENSHHDNGSDSDSSSNSNGSHHTPEKLYESYRPSGSPARVSGSRVAASVKFTDAGGKGLCKVDKSLVCKGFWEEIEEAGRICLPRRSGKTYNLTQLLLFYSISPEEEYLHSVPDSAISTGGISTEDIQSMDAVERCRRKREYLFEGSLLQTMHPAFYQEHFMKYSVLHISFSECKGVTLGGFMVDICDSIISAAEKWMDFVEGRQEYVNPGVQRKLHNLEESLKSCRQIAQGILKLLFQKMLKDNSHLLRGLLFGVFEIPLTEMGSGANNIKDIRMVPCEESDIQGNIL
ncbi:hypothetical protein GGI22_002318, partial [Coemansia erecta]